MPNRAQKLTRQKAASLSVVDSWCAASRAGNAPAPHPLHAATDALRACALFHAVCS